jgi:hypothetical protein
MEISVRVWIWVGAAGTFLLAFPDQLGPFVAAILAGSACVLLSQIFNEKK